MSVLSSYRPFSINSNMDYNRREQIREKFLLFFSFLKTERDIKRSEILLSARGLGRVGGIFFVCDL